MRRPPKPFVTEYKASSRRHAATPLDQTGQETPNPPRASEGGPSGGGDDLYEAAMRAADALFSGPGGKGIGKETTARQSAVQKPKSDAHRAAASLFAEAPPSPAPASEATSNDDKARERTGRILPALDEAPPTQMIELEAALAPKKRGRKPGSKNKPKPVLQSEAPALAADADAPRAAPPKPAERQSSPHIALSPARAALIISEARSAPRVNGPRPEARKDLRMTWARKPLKPGEEWKRRRLPPVCW